MKDISLLGSSFPAFRMIGEPCNIEYEVVEKQKDASSQVLECIYAPDPFTRLPQSDVAVYLSDKVDPSIREFIATQLLTPNPKTDGIPDAQSDIIYDLIRGDNESVSDYAQRINELVASDNEFRMKAASVESSKESE